eukprot:c39002_g1_i1.p2 GENE.c39002_g1_i1~~c39002_g1_i1.p2  ORF type:complete len:292 (+),score=70.78 c39002_g1_i1:56-931(+)
MPVIAIIGSSGSIGAAVIKYLAAKAPAGTTIRAGVRDPASAKAAPLAAANVSLVAASMDDHASMLALFAGADVAFINTPGHADRTQLGLNGIRAATEAGVAHITAVSVFTARVSKTIFGQQFAPIEAALKGTRFTTFRLPFFFDNLLGQAGTIKGHGAAYAPARPDARMSMAWTDELGEAIAAVLLNPAPYANRRLKFGSAPFSHADFAAAVSASRGSAVNYVQVPYEAAKATFLGYGLPEWQVDGVLELFKAADEGEAAIVAETDDFVDVLGREPLTLAGFVAKHAAVFA